MDWNLWHIMKVIKRRGISSFGVFAATRMQLSVLGSDDASLVIWFLMFRDNTVTQCHIPQEPISEMTLFSLSILSFICYLDAHQHISL